MLYKREYLRVNMDPIVELREEHGFRVKEDRRNSTDPDGAEPEDAAALTIRYHLGRAKGEWLKPAYYEMWFADEAKLLEWNVIYYHGSELVLDSEMHIYRELLARCFLAQRTKSQSLWHGGIYACSLLLSPDKNDRDIEEARCRRLCTRLCRTEQEAARATGAVHQQIDLFLYCYIWCASQVYRFVLTLIRNGEIALAIEVIVAINSSIRHSKGIEDIFACIRRLIRKGSANKRASVQRMFTAVRRAVEHTFPNISQAEVTRGDWDNPANFDQKAMQLKMPTVGLARGPRIKKDEFGPKDDVGVEAPETGHRTIGAPDHSGQVGYEFCLLQLEPDPDTGDITDFSPITQSWKASLVVGVHDRLLDKKPVILLDTRTDEVGLVLLKLGGRAVVFQPLQAIELGPDGSVLGGKFAVARQLRPKLVLVTELGFESDVLLRLGQVTTRNSNFDAIYEYAPDTKWLSPLGHAALAGTRHVSKDVMEMIWIELGRGHGLQVPGDRHGQVALLLDMYGASWAMSADKRKEILSDLVKSTRKRNKAPKLPGSAPKNSMLKAIIEEQVKEMHGEGQKARNILSEDEGVDPVDDEILDAFGSASIGDELVRRKRKPGDDDDDEGGWDMGELIGHNRSRHKARHQAEDNEAPDLPADRFQRPSASAPTAAADRPVAPAVAATPSPAVPAPVPGDPPGDSPATAVPDAASPAAGPAAPAAGPAGSPADGHIPPELEGMGDDVFGPDDPCVLLQADGTLTPPAASPAASTDQPQLDTHVDSVAPDAGPALAAAMPEADHSSAGTFGLVPSMMADLPADIPMPPAGGSYFKSIAREWKLVQTKEGMKSWAVWSDTNKLVGTLSVTNPRVGDRTQATRFNAVCRHTNPDGTLCDEKCQRSYSVSNWPDAYLKCRSWLVQGFGKDKTPHQALPR